MSNDKEHSSKVTYSYEQRHVLLLKESFQRDLNFFYKLLDNTPRDWTLTVIQKGPVKELVVNLPAKKK
jgi:hypothetical protein